MVIYTSGIKIQIPNIIYKHKINKQLNNILKNLKFKILGTLRVDNILDIFPKLFNT